MSTSVALQKPRKAGESPPFKPIDEGIWQAWVEKGRARDRRRSATLLMAVKGLSFAGLLVIAALWPRVTPYEVVARFVVAAGSLVLMFHSIDARQYALAAVFGALALFYNPVASVFSFSGDWQRVVIVASAAPVVASLAARNLRTKQHD